MTRKNILPLVLTLLVVAPVLVRADPAELVVQEHCRRDFLKFAGVSEDDAADICDHAFTDHSRCPRSEVCRACRDNLLVQGIPLLSALRACLVKNIAKDTRYSARETKPEAAQARPSSEKPSESPASLAVPGRR